MRPSRPALFALAAALAALAGPAARADPAPFTRRLRFELRAPDAREVVLVGPAAPLVRVPMRRGDDWRWWAVVDLPPGRWAYAFSVDGRTALDPTADGAEPDGAGGERSWLLVRPDDRELRPDPAVPHGTLERRLLRSAVLDEELPYLVYLPPGYDPSRRYPVLFLLHGMNMNESQWKTGGVQHALDNLLAQGRIAPMVAVMPAVPPESFYQGDAETYLATELWPHLVRTLALDARPGRAAVAGISMGGFGAVYLADRHPEIFGRADALSPGTIDGGFLPRLDAALAGGARFPAELAVRCGRQDDLVLPFTEALIAVLERRGVPFAKVLGRGGHDWEFWKGQVAPVLEEASRFMAGPVSGDRGGAPPP